MAPVNEIVTTTATPTSYSHNTPNSYVYFSNPSTESLSTSSTSEEVVGTETSQENLATLLRREGLFAMAKYLRQSGLDTVLNETGKLDVKKLRIYLIKLINEI